MKRWIFGLTAWMALIGGWLTLIRPLDERVAFACLFFLLTMIASGLAAMR